MEPYLQIGVSTDYLYYSFFKGAIHLNAIFLPLDMALTAISHSRLKEFKNPIIIPWICVVGYFVNFWVIFGYIWEEWFFLEGLVKLREIRNIEDLVKFKN